MPNRARILRIVSFAALAAAAAAGDSRASRGNGTQGDQIPADLSIKLERTRCYGFCPSYELTITADGKVSYNGRASVKVVGPTTSRITQEKLRELIRAFEKVGYFELQDAYETPNDGCKDWTTDGPTAITSLTINGRSKSVRHYYGCRGIAVLSELEKLEQAIDDAANTAQWIR